jgi:hypothetical protein
LDADAFNWTLDIIADERREFLMFKNGFAREFRCVVSETAIKAKPDEMESAIFVETAGFTQPWPTVNENQATEVRCCRQKSRLLGAMSRETAKS